MEKLFSTILLNIILVICITAQECPGGLGANLFTAGDFGSGLAYVLEDDPMLAPGYRYEKFGPPNDGEYMITNDVGDWNFVWGSWLVIGDNSPDPNGYMMVVNASFEPGLFYEELIEGLCDNTTYEFSADIINMIRRGQTDHSDPNVAFLIDDVVVLNTGNIPKTERWNTYSFSFDTDQGKTNVKLSLRNNAPGGIGNDLALDNISFRACGPRSEIDLVSGGVEICEEDLPIQLIAKLGGIENTGNIYQWEVSHDHGDFWEVISGEEGSQLQWNEMNSLNPSFRFATATSQESFANVKCRFYSEEISVQISQRTHEVYDTICGGTTIDLGGALLINPGLYMENLISKKGCDSIVLIHLDTVRRAVLSGSLVLTDPGCYGASTGMIAGEEISGGYPPYHLDINRENYEGLVANSLVADNYHVLIEDRFNCFIAFEITLLDPEQLFIEIGPDVQVFLGEEVEIKVESNQDLIQINWTGISSDFNDLTSFTFLPFRDTQLVINGKSLDGCSASDIKNIEVDPHVSIYVPNIFSPNFDLLNDSYYFTPFGKSLRGINYFNIYDRWGSIIWQFNGSEASWNGKNRSGQIANPGVYSFILEGVLINGELIHESGTITVIN